MGQTCAAAGVQAKQARRAMHESTAAPKAQALASDSCRQPHGSPHKDGAGRRESHGWDAQAAKEKQ